MFHYGSSAIDKINAPFTPEQVVALNEFQVSDESHPFTCANRGGGNHAEWNGDQGVLVATVHGWICPFCDYRQDWAYEFMADLTRP